MTKKFTITPKGILGGEATEKLSHTKPHPGGFFLYKPSHRKFDYVDYTGTGKHRSIDFLDKTYILEILGCIKYISSKKCHEGSFK